MLNIITNPIKGVYIGRFRSGALGTIFLCIERFDNLRLGRRSGARIFASLKVFKPFIRKLWIFGDQSQENEIIQ